MSRSSRGCRRRVLRRCRNGSGNVRPKVERGRASPTRRSQRRPHIERSLGGTSTSIHRAETSRHTFDCIYRYGSSLTDAIGYVDPGETSEVLVSDGQIVEFYFPENT